MTVGQHWQWLCNMYVAKFPLAGSYTCYRLTSFDRISIIPDHTPFLYRLSIITTSVHLIIDGEFASTCACDLSSTSKLTVCLIITGDPLHSRALAHSCAPLFTQPCSHCSHSRALGEQWARLCVFTLHGCVQAARLCRGSPVIMCIPKCTVYS